jgi:hypothetical protein
MAPLALALAVAVVPAAALASQAKTAGGSFDVCTTDKAIADGNYEVNNNNFIGKPECLTGENGVAAFTVKSSGASSTTPGSDAFPNIFTGCSWGICSPDSWLPARLSAVGNPVTTFAGTEKASGTWGAGYDMFFDQRPVRTGQGQVEAMIWLNSRNAYDPAGKGWPVVTIDGTQWYAMTWETGSAKERWRYVQFRRKTATASVRDMPLGPFYAYLEKQGWVTPDWYLLNVEAGFEIWNGGTGLAVNQFAVRPDPAASAKPRPAAPAKPAR